MANTMRGLLPSGTAPSPLLAQIKQVAEENGMPPGAIPVFSSLGEALAWEAANPGRTALWLDGDGPGPGPDPGPGGGKTPETVGSLLASWDMTQALTSGGSITSVPDSAGEKTLVAATAGPELTTVSGKRLARFTAASSHRLRWTGPWDHAGPLTICAIMQKGAVSGVVLAIAGVEVESTGNGLIARANAATTPGVTVGASDLVFVSAAYSATTITLRVGTQSQTVSASSVVGDNFAMGARPGGAGTAFTSPTIGRAWVHGKAISQADHDALTAWARSSWGAL